jgi:signal transduction histidine kinase
MDQLQGTGNGRRSTGTDVGLWVWRIGAVLGGAYLVATAVGWLQADRLGWPQAIIFVAILLLHPGLLARLETLRVSGSGFEVALRRLETEQAQLMGEQQRQRNLLEELTFLITHYLPSHELGYLEALANQEGQFDRDWAHDFRGPLRHLRGLGLIEHRPDKPRVHVSELPDRGNLADYFVITSLGDRYLKMRQGAAESANPAPAVSTPTR